MPSILSVRQAAVHLWTANANDVRIVACCVPAKPGVLAPISLRKHLRARLPEYMVPQYFLPVDEIPLTPNGKVDRRRLPTPVVTESRIGRNEAPLDPVEATIAEIWTRLINPSRPIGRFDKFFEIGGHSLLGVQRTSTDRRPSSAQGSTSSCCSMRAWRTSQRNVGLRVSPVRSAAQQAL